jgi:tripartite-type tricarboxylate transporter receptor subunit TctC
VIPIHHECKIWQSNPGDLRLAWGGMDLKEEAMNKKVLLVLGAGLLVCLFPFIVQAAAPFYEGKVIRIIVGHTPGGGFDIYSRALARHVGKHIPGNPSVVVENMPGAGTLIATNYVYKVAGPDGLTIGNVQSNVILDQILGRKGIEYDVRKFEYVGVPIQDFVVIIFSKASGITSVEKWMASKTPVKIGGVLGTNLSAIPKMLQRLTNLPVQSVEGYKGTAEVKLAVESGEIAGGVVGGYPARVYWRRALETGDVVAVLLLHTGPHPEYPNVPLLSNVVNTDDGRQLFRVAVNGLDRVNRLYMLPPGTPPDRVKIIRDAFDKTLMDKDFVEEARKAQLGLDPINGEGVAKIVADMFNLPPHLSAELKEYFK